jgi:isopentenyl diphosphate isomerase/L-lactate dehydrogenase-like FMN-dependent dehydrogenase/predicted DNA-binding transcriptional regulator YafY
MYHPTTRVLTVLELLQSRQQMSGAEIAERLEVDPRTVRRYITMLQDLGIPIESKRGRHGAYQLRPGFKLPPLMFRDDEVFAITIGLIAARKLGLAVAAPAVESALAKIERVLPVTLSEHVRAVQETLVFDVSPAKAAPTSEAVTTLSIATQQRRRIGMRYRAWNAEETERAFDPYGIVCRGGFWYTVGYCHLRADIRVFRLDRILHIEMRDETFTPPTDFNSLEYVTGSLATMPTTWSVEVLLETTLEEARHKISPVLGILEQVPEGVLLRCYVEHLDWMARMLVNLGCPFVVFHPSQLQDTLRQLAEEIARMAARPSSLSQESSNMREKPNDDHFQSQPQTKEPSMQPINLREYEALAQTHMDPAAWDYFQGGSDDEVTLRENCAAFQRIRLRPRVLVDVSTIDMRTTVLGIPVSMPILVAPTGFHGLAHPEGECVTAQAAGDAGTLMGVSTFAHRSLEEIAQAARGPLWFQLYMYRDLDVTGEIVRRADAAGYRAIALTVDTPRLGNRERDRHHTLETATVAHVANFRALEAIEATYLPKPFVPTWETVEWIRSLTSLPIILKGILTAEDALLAVERGVQAIVVSNHGGRQLDTAMATIEALPEVVDAVAGRCEVYVDGGIRRGTDILKALALGARAVLVGRPILWGLAVNGYEGVRHVLEILRSELELAMVLSGCPTLAHINRSLVKVPTA